VEIQLTSWASAKKENTNKALTVCTGFFLTSGWITRQKKKSGYIE
jgi:hypothetical protein